MDTQQRPEVKSSGIDIFRIAGIRISLDFSWFIIFFLLLWSLSAGYFPHVFPNQPVRIYWLAGLLATFLFFSSVLIHELSHSLVAIRLGIKIPSITLFIFGGVSQMSGEAPDPKTELKVAIAGPASSFVLAFIFFAIRNATAALGGPIFYALFNYLMYINLALGIFNLIPGFPLDGGRVLRAIWWWRKGSMSRATKLASDVGKGFAILLIILGGIQVIGGSLIGGLWFVFIGIFLRSVAAGSYQELELRHALEGAKVRDIMVENVIKVSPQTHVDRLIKDYFLHYGYKGFPVASDGAPIGVVSLADIRDVPENEQAMRTAGDVMETLNDDMTVTPDVPLAEAFRKLRNVSSERLIVLDNGRLVGLVTKTGLLRFLELKKVLNHD